MKPAAKNVLSTDIVKIWDTPDHYAVHIKMSEGGWLVHNPFPKTLEGLLGAMMLATDVLAGKFYPAKVLPKESADFLSQPKQLSHDGMCHHGGAPGGCAICDAEEIASRADRSRS